MGPQFGLMLGFWLFGGGGVGARPAVHQSRRAAAHVPRKLRFFLCAAKLRSLWCVAELHSLLYAGEMPSRLSGPGGGTVLR